LEMIDDDDDDDGNDDDVCPESVPATKSSEGTYPVLLAKAEVDPEEGMPSALLTDALSRGLGCPASDPPADSGSPRARRSMCDATRRFKPGYGGMRPPFASFALMAASLAACPSP